jgi:hypothetical protein
MGNQSFQFHTSKEEYGRKNMHRKAPRSFQRGGLSVRSLQHMINSTPRPIPEASGLVGKALGMGNKFALNAIAQGKKDNSFVPLNVQLALKDFNGVNPLASKLLQSNPSLNINPSISGGLLPINQILALDKYRPRDKMNDIAHGLAFREKEASERLHQNFKRD